MLWDSKEFVKKSPFVLMNWFKFDENLNYCSAWYLSRDWTLKLEVGSFEFQSKFAKMSTRQILTDSHPKLNYIGFIVGEPYFKLLWYHFDHLKRQRLHLKQIPNTINQPQFKTQIEQSEQQLSSKYKKTMLVFVLQYHHHSVLCCSLSVYLFNKRQSRLS